MKSWLNHKMWRLRLFICCAIIYLAADYAAVHLLLPMRIFLLEVLEVVCEIVMWRHECMQASIRQKRGKLVIYLAVISPFFGKSKHIFSLCLCLCFSHPHSKEGRKLCLKRYLVLTQIWLGNERQISAVGWAKPYIRSSLRICSLIASFFEKLMAERLQKHR